MQFPFLTERRKLVKAIDLILSGDADMNDVNEFHNKQTFDQVGIQSDLLSQRRESHQNIAASMDDTTHLLIEGNQKTENCLTEMEQMSELFQSNQALSGYCLALGKYMFKIGRYNDKTRSDLLRNVSSVST